MDLESRMATVERDLSSVREQELPSLRSDMERKYHDLRVETHGWAEVAIKASKKVDSASEIVNLIYTEIRETKDDVRAVRGELAEFRTETRGELANVRGEIAEVREEVAEVRGEVAEVREEVAEVKGEVAEVKGEVAQVRGEVGRVRAEQDVQRGVLVDIQQELAEQGDTLQKILARLS
jgi:septal ring factor EnvC (AmiA/AmiB activator)